jgi:hypothetical protein
MQAAACNALHCVKERTCKWLLRTHDRVVGNEFTLTQEFLGVMLGVRRASVTLVAHELQKAGMIYYRSGYVTVLDRKGLEESSCECCAVVRAYFDKFLERLCPASPQNKRVCGSVNDSNRAGIVTRTSPSSTRPAERLARRRPSQSRPQEDSVGAPRRPTA